MYDRAHKLPCTYVGVNWVSQRRAMTPDCFSCLDRLRSNASCSGVSRDVELMHRSAMRIARDKSRPPFGALPHAGRALKSLYRIGRRLCRQKAVGFLLHHAMTLAGRAFQGRPIEHRNCSATVHDHAELLQFTGTVRNFFTAHTEHVGDELLSHH